MDEQDDFLDELNEGPNFDAIFGASDEMDDIFGDAENDGTRNRDENDSDYYARAVSFQAGDISKHMMQIQERRSSQQNQHVMTVGSAQPSDRRQVAEQALVGAQGLNLVNASATREDSKDEKMSAVSGRFYRGSIKRTNGAAGGNGEESPQQTPAGDSLVAGPAVNDVDVNEESAAGSKLMDALKKIKVQRYDDVSSSEIDLDEELLDQAPVPGSDEYNKLQTQHTFQVARSHTMGRQGKNSHQVSGEDPQEKAKRYSTLTHANDQNESTPKQDSQEQSISYHDKSSFQASVIIQDADSLSTPGSGLKGKSGISKRLQSVIRNKIRNTSVISESKGGSSPGEKFMSMLQAARRKEKDDEIIDLAEATKKIGKEVARGLDTLSDYKWLLKTIRRNLRRELKQFNPYLRDQFEQGTSSKVLQRCGTNRTDGQSEPLFHSGGGIARSNMLSQNHRSATSRLTAKDEEMVPSEPSSPVHRYPPVERRGRPLKLTSDEVKTWKEQPERASYLKRLEGFQNLHQFYTILKLNYDQLVMAQRHIGQTFHSCAPMLYNDQYDIWEVVADRPQPTRQVVKTNGGTSRLPTSITMIKTASVLDSAKEKQATSRSGTGDRGNANARGDGKLSTQMIQENINLQLMMLLAAGDIRSCRFNTAKHRKPIDTVQQKGGKGESAGNRTDKVTVQTAVSLTLLLAKCHIIEAKEHSVDEASKLLNESEHALREGLLSEFKDLRKHLHDKYRERLDQHNPGGAESKSKSQTEGGGKGRKKAADFNDFRWMLSALGLTAALWNSIGQHDRCELAYAEYINRVEDFYERNSAEVSNAYFMVGIYYFERDLLQKALACLLKALFIRRKEHGPESPGAADCHFNIGVIYKRLAMTDRALMHFQSALDIRRKVVGPRSIPVAEVLEQIGKFKLQMGQLQAAYDSLQECYLIRKRLYASLKGDSANSNIQVQRVALLIMYVHQELQKGLEGRKRLLDSDAVREGGIRLLDASLDIKSMLADSDDTASEKQMATAAKKPMAAKVDLKKEAFLSSAAVSTPRLLGDSSDFRVQSQMSIMQVSEIILQPVAEVQEKKQQQKSPEKLQQLNKDQNDARKREEKPVANVVSEALHNFIDNVQKRLNSSQHMCLVAFILSLSQRQLQQLQQDQAAHQNKPLLYISEEFLMDEINADVVQLHLFRRSQIWRISKKDYLVNLKLPIGPGNLLIGERRGKGHVTEKLEQSQRDATLMNLIKQVPEFMQTLIPIQSNIFKQVLQREWPLKYFFISIHESQLTDFERVHASLKNDEERKAILIELSSQFGSKLDLDSLKPQNYSFSYAQEIEMTLCRLVDVKALLHLVDVTNLVEDLGETPFTLYVQLVEMAQRAYHLTVVRAQARGRPELGDAASSEEQEILERMKMTLMELLQYLDPLDLYTFASHNLFLVDANELARVEQEPINFHSATTQQSDDDDIVIAVSEVSSEVADKLNGGNSGRKSSEVHKLINVDLNKLMKMLKVYQQQRRGSLDGSEEQSPILPHSDSMAPYQAHQSIADQLNAFAAIQGGDQRMVTHPGNLYHAMDIETERQLHESGQVTDQNYSSAGLPMLPQNSHQDILLMKPVSFMQSAAHNSQQILSEDGEQVRDFEEEDAHGEQLADGDVALGVEHLVAEHANQLVEAMEE